MLPTSPRMIRVAVAIVGHRGKILVCRRPPGVDLAGYWEFPGGKMHPGETPEAAAVRELKEETGVDAVPFARLSALQHDYTHASVVLTPVLCHWQRGIPRPLASSACLWADVTELSDYPFPPANELLLRQLAEARPFAPASPVANPPACE